MDDLSGKTSERRQLTVLFCDIVDSTGLSERCDPEDLSEFCWSSRRSAPDASRMPVATSSTTSAMAFAPSSVIPSHRRTRPIAAVRAGLVLLRAVAELSERATTILKEPLHVRIGVHTGFAVIGKAAVGHVHHATEIVGDTPNIAFRLLEAGGPTRW